MAFDVYELFKSRKITADFDTSTTVLEMYGKKSFDESEVFAAFLAASPLTFGGVPFKSLDVQPIGGGHWTATATYSTKGTTEKIDGQAGPTASTTPTPPTVPGATDPLTHDYSIDINTYTEKITQSKFTEHMIKRGGGDPPDNKNAIGITQDGEILGCDRIAPGLEFSITKTLGFITRGYLIVLYELTAKVNSATFYGFPAGSVLFMGAQARPKDTSSVTVQYKFSVSPEETDITICDGLVVPSKKGHEFLWVSYKDATSENVLWKIPDAAYVERIYDEGDFSLLGLGG